MPFRFPLLIALLLMSSWWIKGTYFENRVVLQPVPFDHASFPDEKISVRESTVDLQISVGHKIFVFGKAKGTLDKVKVGMHVLPFSQVPGAQGNESTFTKVSWKKLKDGSIQIQSSYNPWPMGLTWTVLANGELKMEVSSLPQNYANEGWLGLGFNYPDHQLMQVSWKGGKPLSPDGQGHWKNQNFIPLAETGQEIKNSPDSLFQQIQSLKLEFESMMVEVRTENQGVHFGLRQVENQTSNYPKISSDLVFFIKHAFDKTDHLPQTTSENKLVNNSLSLNPLVLWFHFQ
ncbi:MAG TPA: hypothetical protein VLA71_11650 [Algoriphagus sp.]|nr:hypothetical protein [Algoriphagus sp.]